MDTVSERLQIRQTEHVTRGRCKNDLVRFPHVSLAASLIP